MQTLGLSSHPQPTDNLFKRLFWPVIESQYDVDLIGQQGFWVCTAVAILSLIIMLIMRMPIIGIVTAIVFFLGGCGVRQRSVAASVLVFLLYLINLVGGIWIGSFGNPLIQLVVLMLLFANVRATILSRRWIAQPSDPIDQELPERLMETVEDKFSNRLPATLWPRSHFVFFPTAVIMLLLTAIGLVMIKRQLAARRTEPASTSVQELQVSPR